MKNTRNQVNMCLFLHEIKILKYHFGKYALYSPKNFRRICRLFPENFIDLRKIAEYVSASKEKLVELQLR